MKNILAAVMVLGMLMSTLAFADLGEREGLGRQKASALACQVGRESVKVVASARPAVRQPVVTRVAAGR